MTLLYQWMRSLADQPQLTLSAPFECEGRVDKHLGGTWLKAGARVRIEPGAGDWRLPDGLDAADAQDFAKHFAFGVFDKLFTSRFGVISQVTVYFCEVQVDEIRSSRLAFRKAGQMAGNAAIEAIGRDEIAVK